jgi:hypothetical protein
MQQIIGKLKVNAKEAEDDESKGAVSDGNSSLASIFGDDLDDLPPQAGKRDFQSAGGKGGEGAANKRQRQ